MLNRQLSFSSLRKLLTRSNFTTTQRRTRRVGRSSVSACMQHAEALEDRTLLTGETQFSLVADINQEVPAGDNPAELTVVNGTLFYSARLNGKYTVIRNDGTQAGTYALGNWDQPVAQLTDIDSTLFFRAYTPEGGTELWKSDGTEAGTTLVKDINAGTGSSEPELPDGCGRHAVF